MYCFIAILLWDICMLSILRNQYLWFKIIRSKVYPKILKTCYSAIKFASVVAPELLLPSILITRIKMKVEQATTWDSINVLSANYVNCSQFKFVPKGPNQVTCYHNLLIYTHIEIVSTDTTNNSEVMVDKMK